MLLPIPTDDWMPSVDICGDTEKYSALGNEAQSEGGEADVLQRCLHPTPRNACAMLRRLIEGVPFCHVINPSLCCQK